MTTLPVDELPRSGLWAVRAATRLTLGGAIVGAGSLEALPMLLTPSAVLLASPIPLLKMTGVISGIALQRALGQPDQSAAADHAGPPAGPGDGGAAVRDLLHGAGWSGGGWPGVRMGNEATMLAGGGVTLAAALSMWSSPIRDAR